MTARIQRSLRTGRRFVAHLNQYGGVAEKGTGEPDQREKVPGVTRRKPTRITPAGRYAARRHRYTSSRARKSMKIPRAIKALPDSMNVPVRYTTKGAHQSLQWVKAKTPASPIYKDSRTTNARRLPCHQRYSNGRLQRPRSKHQNRTGPPHFLGLGYSRGIPGTT